MALPDLPAIYRRESADPSVIVADGQNVTVTVRNNQLRISDGARSQRRERAITRADRTVTRVVVLGEFGYITLDALRWMEQEGIAIAQVERDGKVVMTGPGNANRAAIRRAQALASVSGMQRQVTGVAGTFHEIHLAAVKAITVRKLAGQADIARTFLASPDAADAIQRLIDDVMTQDNAVSVNSYEGRAAALYWDTWQSRVTVPFSPRDMLNAPANWLRFPGRKSRPGATDPVNAMLNYAYSVAETEARHACHIAGLDPGIGFMHVISEGREAMALDLMEVARPVADRVVLTMCDYGQGIRYDSRGKPVYFPANWLYEIRHGVTRLFAPLTHMIAEHAAEMAEAIAPVAGELARQLEAADLGNFTPGVKPKRVLKHYGTVRQPGKPMRVSPLTGKAVTCADDVIPADVWRKIVPQIPALQRQMGPKRIDDRLVLAGIVWCAANNRPFRQAPPALGVSDATYRNRRLEWKDSGAWPHIVRAVQRNILPGFDGK